MKKVRKTQKQFEKEVYEQTQEEYKFLEPYINAKTKIKVVHNICSFEYSVSPDKFLNKKTRCPNCNGGHKKSESKFLHDLKEAYGEEIQLVGMYHGARTNTEFFNTVSQNSFTATPDNVLRGVSLGRKISNGEYLIKTYLDSNNIIYIHQYKFKELKRMAFDFYLEEYNLLIEYDGEQHFEVVEHFGGEQKFKMQQKNDKLKNKFCENNNIKLLRIPYWEKENIDAILQVAI